MRLYIRQILPLDVQNAFSGAAHILPLSPKCQGDARLGIFSLTESENYFITEEDEESYLWFPPALGRLFLERAPRPESFHKWSTLCSVKEN